MTTQQGWLSAWTEFMMLREFIQNFRDFVCFKWNSSLVMGSVQQSDDYKWLEPWMELIRQARAFPLNELKRCNGMKFYAVRLASNGKIVGYIAEGRAMFMITQLESTLSMESLFQSILFQLLQKNKNSFLHIVQSLRKTTRRQR